jgi:hypothetical protein
MALPPRFTITGQSSVTAVPRAFPAALVRKAATCSSKTTAPSQSGSRKKKFRVTAYVARDRVPLRTKISYA